MTANVEIKTTTLGDFITTWYDVLQLQPQKTGMEMWGNLKQKALIDLNDFRQNIYSSAGIRPSPCYGEDGVLLEIFRVVIPSESPLVVEFGELRSLGTTTRSIRLKYQARAVYFSGTLDIKSRLLNILDILRVTLGHRKVSYLKFLTNLPFRAWISTEEFPRELKNLAEEKVDLVVVDIDSFDFQVVEKMLLDGIHPTCFVVEYNPSLPKDVPLYLSELNSRIPNLRPRVYGASYAAWEYLFNKHGYRLVHISGFCNLIYLIESKAHFFARPHIATEITDSDEKVLAFAKKWCLPGFLPSWLASSQLNEDDFKLFNKLNTCDS